MTKRGGGQPKLAKTKPGSGVSSKERLRRIDRYVRDYSVEGLAELVVDLEIAMGIPE